MWGSRRVGCSTRVASASPSGDFVGRLDGGFTLTAQVTGAIPAGQGGDGCTAPPANSEVTAVLINLVALNAVTSGNLRISAEGVVAAGGVVVFDTRSTLNSNAVVSDVTLDGSGNGFVDVKVGAGSVPDAVDVRGVVLGYFVRATDVFESFSRTIVVPADGTPAQNGTALRAAEAEAFAKTPTASDPWLLKLEPGTYDVGNTDFSIRDHIHLEGSGRDATILTGNSSDNTLRSNGTHNNVSDLTVQNTGTGRGYELAGAADARITRAKLTSLSKPGLRVFGTSTATVIDTTMVGGNWGLLVDGSPSAATVTDSTATGPTGARVAASASLTLVDSVLTGTSANGFEAIGTSNAAVSGSTIVGTTNGVSTGTGGTDTATVDIVDSSVTGATGITVVGSLSAGPATVDVTGSDVTGTAGDGLTVGGVSEVRYSSVTGSAEGVSLVLGAGVSGSLDVYHSTLTSTGVAATDYAVERIGGVATDLRVFHTDLTVANGIPDYINGTVTCVGVTTVGGFFQTTCPS